MSAEIDSSASVDIPAPTDTAGRTWENVSAFRHDLSVPVSFPDHRHNEHELVWLSIGTARFETPLGAWLLTPGTAAWVPAGAVHALTVSAPAELHAVHLAVGLDPGGERWRRAHVFESSPLMAAICTRLESRELSDVRRRSTTEVLLEVLDESEPAQNSLPLPLDPRARRIASAILGRLDDRRELRDWANELGVSTKTLARAFRSETSLTFTEWRTQARMAASLGLLAEGRSVEQVADQVGFRSSSAFIAAFRARTGSSPGAYRRSLRDRPGR